MQLASNIRNQPSSIPEQVSSIPNHNIVKKAISQISGTVIVVLFLTIFTDPRMKKLFFLLLSLPLTSYAKQMLEVSAVAGVGFHSTPSDKFGRVGGSNVKNNSSGFYAFRAGTDIGPVLLVAKVTMQSVSSVAQEARSPQGESYGTDLRTLPVTYSFANPFISMSLEASWVIHTPIGRIAPGVSLGYGMASSRSSIGTTVIDNKRYINTISADKGRGFAFGAHLSYTSFFSKHFGLMLDGHVMPFNGGGISASAYTLFGVAGGVVFRLDAD
jgi:hypothetical protein